jgi:triacylglycerol lipase
MAQFDPRFARDTLLLLAEAAYIPDKTQLTLPPNYTVVGPISLDKPKLVASFAAAIKPRPSLLAALQASPDIFGWIFQDASMGTVVASFRGTSNLKDWATDFDFFPEPYRLVPDYGTVHQGFQLVYISLMASVKSLLQQAKPNCKRLILTGHSLGAALSVIAAPDILHNCGLSVAPEVQNFAGPRAAHSDFARAFDVEIDACFRVVNQWDIVPQLPPPLALFEHVGAAVRLDGGFTLDELVAHSMEKSYGPGLTKLLPPPGGPAIAPIAVSAISRSQPNAMLIGREP